MFDFFKEKKKSNVVIFFFVATFALVLINFILELTIQKKVLRSNNSPQIEKEKIESLFLETLSERGIGKKFVSIKKIKKNGDLINSYIIVAPNDFSVPLLIADLQEQILFANLRILSREKKNKPVSIEIFYGDNLLFEANINFSLKAAIQKNKISILIYDFYRASEFDKKIILNWPFKLNLLLLLDSDYKKIIESKKPYKKFYFLSNDDVKDIKYKINPKNSQARLKAAASNIASLIAENNILFYDNNSAIVKSSQFEIVKNEFDKRKIRLFGLQRFKVLQDENINELISKITFGMDPENIKKEIYLLSYEDFLRTKARIEKLIKKGTVLYFFEEME